MSGNEQDVFAKYAPKPHTRLEVIDGGKQKTGKHDYRAYGIDTPRNRTARLRIEHNDADLVITSLAKSYLVEIQYSAQRFIALIFTSCAFLLEGENLDKLVELLDEDQVKSIHGFNPKLHQMPAEGEAVITNIRRMGFQELAESSEDNQE